MCYVKVWCVSKWHEWRQITSLVISFRKYIAAEVQKKHYVFFPPPFIMSQIHLLNPGVQNDIWSYIVEPQCSWPG